MRLVDAHVHVWPATAPVEDPLVARAGTVEALYAALDGNGVAGAVVVQPSICGADHGHLLAAVGASAGRLAAVVLAEPDVPSQLDELEALLAESGVVGVRLPLIRAPRGWLEEVGERVWSACRHAGAAVCPWVGPEHYAALGRWMDRFPDVPVVVDHFGRVDLAGEDRASAVRDLCALAVHPAAHVKASALMALSHEPPPHRDLAAVVAALLAAFGPQRVMWGTDHPMFLAEGSYADAARAARGLLEPHGPHASRAVLGETASRVFWGAGA